MMGTAPSKRDMERFTEKHHWSTEELFQMMELPLTDAEEGVHQLHSVMHKHYLQKIFANRTEPYNFKNRTADTDGDLLVLPMDTIFYILSFLALDDLGTMSMLNFRWFWITEQPILWKFRYSEQFQNAGKETRCYKCVFKFWILELCKFLTYNVSSDHIFTCSLERQKEEHT
jgi:hypothetical protein